MSNSIGMLYVGTDIENVSRIDHLWKQKPSILRRFFFPSEWEYFTRYGHSTCTLTGIWCAKEAVVKAVFPTIKLDIRDVEILSKKGAPPTLILHQVKGGLVDPSIKVTVSISHTKEYATATAIHWVENPIEQLKIKP